MSSLRTAVAGLLVVVALILQVAVFPHVAWEGIVPDLCLLVVVAAALVRGPAFAATLGFFAGLLLDLAPPADHVAGRWALSLVVVGCVAGLMRQDTRTQLSTVVATVAASSFVGTSVFALTGLVLGDSVGSPADLAKVILVALLWDVLLAPVVLPGLMRLLTRLEPAGAR
ncbi:MAG TPA: rod shape-determining protein MreD [Nocardioides sp.]|jgi:rod shape-determining protein MreD|uniref:rod shape-determining protein MreD n=1 Tax=Nocardioides sp. TaxID=35761 RepID=UPI002E340CDF|nr:rod shape-determining protein MreD [Nocardioides sp.]HEX3931888.1 rod shape-determining protein MreD [Nocardioides sp.]